MNTFIVRIDKNEVPSQQSDIAHKMFRQDAYLMGLFPLIISKALLIIKVKQNRSNGLE